MDPLKLEREKPTLAGNTGEGAATPPENDSPCRPARADSPTRDLMTSGDGTTHRREDLVASLYLPSCRQSRKRSAFWEKNHQDRSEWRFRSEQENKS